MPFPILFYKFIDFSQTLLWAIDFPVVLNEEKCLFSIASHTMILKLKKVFPDNLFRKNLALANVVNVLKSQ